jgi:uncharacterized membrane protein
MSKSLIASLLFFVGACFALAAHPAPARAAFTLCNQSGAKVYAAIGYHDASEPTDLSWYSRGWWTLQPGDCKTPISGSIPVRYIYVYGETEGYTRYWTGNYSFCTVTDMFQIWGSDNDKCEGGTLRHFLEVDVGSASDYTYTFR